ncbi:MAG: transposase [Erythrobacter sp.]
MSPFDPSDEANLSKSADWLRKLANNRQFLGDLLLDQIKDRYCEPALERGYGPQAIALSQKIGGTFLRANIWPSERDHCFQASGGETFVYGIPHDHNFSLLTCGYLGPGYRSDYYEYDYETVAGFAGEKVPLRFIERSALGVGKMMLYRAHRDIHSQLPLESLSVSLNVMHIGPAQGWHDQYGFDLDAGEMTRVLSPNSTEVFLRTAIATAQPEALDLAEKFGKGHPCDRLRLASYEARALLLDEPDLKDALWREAEQSGCRMLEAIAKQRRTAISAMLEPAE